MRLLRRSAITLSVLLVASCGILGGDDDPNADNLKKEDFIPSGNPNGKDTGGECAVGNDCKSGVCTDAKCAEPNAHDGVRNGDETGLDCGGPTAPKCTGGSPCKVESDCASNQCVDGRCGGPKEDPPKPDDGKKNGEETDVDCGGPVAPKCADGKGCKAASDCTSGVCKSDVCQAPKPDDGVKNGTETDVDCGGANAPKCAVDKACTTHSDCQSDGCAYNNKCALSRSCTVHFGGDTCGSGEVGQAGAQHESCCKALPIPGGGNLDKYQITAGRMKAFVERTNGQILQWYEANKASLSQTARNQIEAYKNYLPQDKTSYPFGTEYQLGGTAILPKKPSDFQGCYIGNQGNQAYGSHTYDNGNIEGEDQGISKDERATRALNCVPYPILAAFCAWDGGTLQTQAQHNAAWGAAQYPWGASPHPAGYRNIGGVWTKVSGQYPGAQFNQPCPGCDDTYANWENNYQYPPGGNQAKPWDMAYWISAPGRFPKGNSASGHADLAGNIMEIVADTNGSESTQDYSGATVTQTRVRWSRNGSWEGHAIGYPDFAFAFMTKYGKTGGRCAR